MILLSYGLDNINCYALFHFRSDSKKRKSSKSFGRQIVGQFKRPYYAKATRLREDFAVAREEQALLRYKLRGAGTLRPRQLCLPAGLRPALQAGARFSPTRTSSTHAGL